MNVVLVVEFNAQRPNDIKDYMGLNFNASMEPNNYLNYISSIGKKMILATIPNTRSQNIPKPPSYRKPKETHTSKLKTN